jgi:hypothetical protein
MRKSAREIGKKILKRVGPGNRAPLDRVSRSVIGPRKTSLRSNTLAETSKKKG